MAQVTIDFSMKTQVEGFLNFLTKRAVDPVHAINGDCIADFVEKFMVVELKRLEVADEFIPGTIELPAELFKEPIEAVSSEDFELPAPAIPFEDSEFKKRKTPSRSGNGHVAKKERDLDAHEKNTIRSRFISLDGRIEEDLTVQWTKEFNDRAEYRGDKKLTAFQVPGFVSYLHGKVTSGEIKPNDPDAYKAFLDSHRALYPKRYPGLAEKAKALSGASVQADAAATLWTNRS